MFVQESFLIEKPPDERGHKQGKRDEARPRAERKRRPDE